MRIQVTYKNHRNVISREIIDDDRLVIQDGVECFQFNDHVLKPILSKEPAPREPTYEEVTMNGRFPA